MNEIKKLIKRTEKEIEGNQDCLKTLNYFQGKLAGIYKLKKAVLKEIDKLHKGDKYCKCNICKLKQKISRSEE
jgi:hypothetical protein